MRVETMSEMSHNETVSTRLLAVIGCVVVVLLLALAIARPSSAPTPRTHPPVLAEFHPR